MTSTGPRRLGKYELRERLARGGQGEVWKAFDPQLRRYVAIKQLPPSNALEVIERLQAVRALVLRLARRGAELAYPRSVGGSAVRTFDR